MPFGYWIFLFNATLSIIRMSIIRMSIIVITGNLKPTINA